MVAKSRAEVIWENDLLNGSGTVMVESGSFSALPVTWAARTERPAGKTSPEELLAASHASCYAMALASTLAKRGTPPQRLNVSAVCTFEKVGDAFKVTMMELTVRGNVAGLDQPRFEDAAKAAEKVCPISNALRNNVEIKLSPQLE